VPWLTQPSTLCGTVKWVSAFGLSNNNGNSGCKACSLQGDLQPKSPKSVGLVWRSAVAWRGYLHSSDEPSVWCPCECPCYCAIEIVMVIIIIINISNHGSCILVSFFYPTVSIMADMTHVEPNKAQNQTKPKPTCFRYAVRNRMLSNNLMAAKEFSLLTFMTVNFFSCLRSLLILLMLRLWPWFLL